MNEMMKTTEQSPFLIETPRLWLREMSLADKASIAAILRDERVMYAYEGAFDDEETTAWIEKQLRRYADYGFGLWAALLKETGELVGQCGITMQEYQDRLVPEIGYLLARKYWHQGYAIEAAKACREYGFHTLHFDKLYSIIRDTNLASQKVALRNGMQPVGTLAKHYRGAVMPHIVFCTEQKNPETGQGNPFPSQD